ncbi:unnamed protein product [Closterium sp. Yama58-4]|nr:unnamed protein product [Closterium sp. Yama58-4]
MSTMTHLKHVHIDTASGFTSDGIKCLFSLPQLERLELKGSVVTDSTLEGIGAASSTLKLLYLNRTKVTDAGLPHLTSLPSLKTLILYECEGVTSAGMVHVGKLTSLEELYLNRSRVRDEGLQYLAPLTNLTMLLLPEKITDAGMEHVQHLSGLQWLEFFDSFVSGKGVQLLKGLLHLKQVRLESGSMLFSMRGDNEDAESPSEHQAGTDGVVLAMMMRLRALEGQLEETRRGLEEAERRRAEETLLTKGEMLTVKGELVTVRGELVATRGELVTGVLATVKGELEAIKGEILTVKGELATKTLATTGGELVTVKGELETSNVELVTVKGELATREELVTEEGESEATKVQLATLNGELETVKGGLKEATRELAEQKECLQKVETEKLALEEKVKELKEKAVKWDEAAALICPAPKNVEFDVEEELKKSEGSRKLFWQRVHTATTKATLDLKVLSDLSDAFLTHVATMTHLKHVHIDLSAGLTSEGIKCLYSLPQLESLELKGSVVTNSTLAGIGRVRALKFLYLNRTDVSDSGLLHLTCLPYLETLILYFCDGVTCAGMVHVGRMSSLEELYLLGTGVKDEGLRFLTPLKRLRMLILPNTITDAGVEYIQHLTALECLDFSRSEATNKSVGFLQKLTRLTQIKADSDRFQRLLKAYLPGVKVGSELPPSVILGD